MVTKNTVNSINLSAPLACRCVRVEGLDGVVVGRPVRVREAEAGGDAHLLAEVHLREVEMLVRRYLEAHKVNISGEGFD